MSGFALTFPAREKTDVCNAPLAGCHLIFHLFNSQSMKKSDYLPFFIRRHDLLKTLLIMKLTIAILIAACLQVSAKTYSQTRITLSLQSVELRKALFIIEKKISYR